MSISTLSDSGGTHPFHAFRFLRQDRFSPNIISWMFLGFATLMMAPLRVEYLATGDTVFACMAMS